MPKYYVIAEPELRDLLKNDLELGHLEAGGVDNWEWYGEGRRQYLEEVASAFLSKEEIDKEEDLDEGFVAELILQNFKTVEEFNKEREVSHNVK